MRRLITPLASLARCPSAGGCDRSLNASMNGEKGMLSEGGIRVLWLAYWAGTIPGGQVYEHPVSSTQP